MDDETRAFFGQVETSITSAIVEGFDRAAGALGDTMVRQLDDAAERRHVEAANLAREHHTEAMTLSRQQQGETLRKFQRVVDEAERIGAATARDRRVEELEERVGKQEALLPPGSRQ